MAIIKKIRGLKKKKLVWMWEKGTLQHCWGECKLVHLLWKTVRKHLKKLKKKLSYNPAISLLEIQPKEMKTQTQKDTCTLIFIAALYLIAAKIWKQLKCLPLDEWIEKLWYIYINTYTYTLEYHSTIKNEAILPLATTWMILTALYQLKEVRQRRTNTVISHVKSQT